MLEASHDCIFADSISKLTLATLALLTRHTQRNPQSSGIKQPKQIFHGLESTTKRSEEGLITHVTLQSAHV